MLHAGMRRFAEKALEARIVGNWLEVPEGTHLLGEPERGRFLYVREAYKALQRALEKARSEGTRHAVVSGNPGVGKSWFAMYLLIW